MTVTLAFDAPDIVKAAGDVRSTRASRPTKGLSRTSTPSTLSVRRPRPFSVAMSAAIFVLRDWGLTALLHARGEPAEVASRFIAISIPANVPLALGMTLTGVLRAVGDGRASRPRAG